MNNNKEKNNNNISIPPPRGSVLRIFHGKIVMNHNYIKNVSLFSTNKYQKIIKFPIFDKSYYYQLRLRQLDLYHIVLNIKQINQE